MQMDHRADMGSTLEKAAGKHQISHSPGRLLITGHLCIYAFAIFKPVV